MRTPSIPADPREASATHRFRVSEKQPGDRIEGTASLGWSARREIGFGVLHSGHCVLLA